MISKTFLRLAVLLGLLVHVYMTPVGASRSVGVKVKTSDIQSSRPSSLRPLEESASALRRWHLLPPDVSLVDYPKMTSKTTFVHSTRIPKNEPNPTRHSTTDLALYLSSRLTEYTSSTPFPKRASVRTLVVAGAIITTKMFIDNILFIRGTPTSTDIIEDFFMQIVRNIAEKWQYLDPSQNLEVKMGRLTLRMEARGGQGNETIAWTFVSEYAVQMAEWAARGLLGFVDGVIQFLFLEGGVLKMGLLFFLFHFFNGEQPRGALAG